MARKHISRLSFRRIFLSLFLFISTPFIAFGLNLWVNNQTISYTFALTFVGWLLVLYDWNLFGIHYNRFKSNPGDGLIYTFVGILLIGAWSFFNIRFLQANVLIPDRETVSEYAFFAPAILFGFSFMKASVMSIAFKCLTDRFVIRDQELMIILLSGFLFGALQTLVFTPWNDIALLVRTYLYNVVLVAILSYLYNQSTSFIPGLIAMTVLTIVFTFI